MFSYEHNRSINNNFQDENSFTWKKHRDLQCKLYSLIKVPPRKYHPVEDTEHLTHKFPCSISNQFSPCPRAITAQHSIFINHICKISSCTQMDSCRTLSSMPGTSPLPQKGATLIPTAPESRRHSYCLDCSSSPADVRSFWFWFGETMATATMNTPW